MKRVALIILFAMFAFSGSYGQRPGGPPPVRPGNLPQPRDVRPPQPGREPQMADWTQPHDVDRNGVLDATEFAAAMERTFKELDRDGSGSIEPGEAIRPQRPARPGSERTPPVRPPGGAAILPPFFFLDRVKEDRTISRAEFVRIVRETFVEMDGNGDGSLSGVESKRLPQRPDSQPPGSVRPPMPPNARFIGAELRFGDKLVKGQPFSAEIVVENTKRLFDGSTVVTQSRGAIYRDKNGRTRREQPLDMVGGVSVVGTDGKPQKLVFINDPADEVQIFLDLNNKSARKLLFRTGAEPLEPAVPFGVREESLGSKNIEGITVEGTRRSFEIPAGELGNDQPLQVVTERWLSKELDAIVFLRHVDPIAGEHIFNLVNIKRTEPNPDLFTIPGGFKIENQGRKQLY
ncbi:MAG: hypothetical protein WBO10_08650 [Pyrinomonadaceae bacterium]